MDTKNNSWVFLCVIVLGFFMCSNKTHHAIAAVDTISLGDSLTGDQTLTSKGDKFVLGFFKPAGNTFQNYYIGIWYYMNIVSVQTVVWVANRDSPILDPSSSKLTLLADGNLVLLNNLTTIWSTNLASNTLNTNQLVLGDDGNLVLRDGSNPNVVYWQSFDYPTDTWLPGGKIGFSKKTNQTQKLTSWRNRQDPATGIYNGELGPNRIIQLVHYWNKSKQIWKSGEWDEKSKTFLLLPEMRLNDEINYSVISNVNESYFTYSINGKSTIARFVMDISGQLRQYTWSIVMDMWLLTRAQPRRLCDVYSICGPFGNCILQIGPFVDQDTKKCECLPGFIPRYPTDWSLEDSTGGCVRKTSLQCGNEDDFSPIRTSKLPDKPRFSQTNTSGECKSACEGTCSCIAYAFADNGCRYWDKDIINLNQFTPSGGPTIFYLRLAATARKGKELIWKIVVPLVVTIMGVLGCIYLFKRNKANKRGRLEGLQGVMTDLLKSKATNNDTPYTNMFDDGKTKGETREFQIFSLACLAKATNNFCLENKLGEGGFGPVYKGKLQNEEEIAVKRLSKSSGQGIEEFKNEVLLISKLQHRNLVKLLGCCVEGDEYMLIYEYMPKGSLDAFLFDPRKKAQLSWDKRFNIIGGIARGLLYLHRDSRLRVIHRDLKVSNILLDENMTPKISDFGMARIFGGDQIIDNTKRVVGTFGYMSPEYITGGTFSEKSDVFSFGVLILEIVSSKRNNSFYDPEECLNLILHTWRLWNEGKWSEVVDDGLGDSYSASEVIKCIHIGLLCVQNRAIDRPTMAVVDTMLGSETDRPVPKEPPYIFPTSSSDKPIHSSNNVTFTAVEGR